MFDLWQTRRRREEFFRKLLAFKSYIIGDKKMTTDDDFPDIIKIVLQINEMQFATTPEEIAIKLSIDGIELSSIPENLDIAILIDTFKKLQEEVEGEQKSKNSMFWKRIPHLTFNNTANNNENNIRVIVNGEERSYGELSMNIIN